ncbi:Transcriptional regulatory protein UME6 [Fusarium austroafricanum]|uniref:Transcriptional regulatory protein UME6 n=1 Tax=Fusarium austroafricanum TaxID=2364996 RepID=A0A8H4KQU6_9HYPO|nr:Transcriptional regulatory protein UME6 [Fusarium austroafricanum]
MRNNGSCWICRVRHKKCDETRPYCQNCVALGLTCLFGHQKPTWMDNGDLQREMSQRLKAQVKRNARNRRGRQMIDRIAQNLDDDEIGVRRDSRVALLPTPISGFAPVSESADDTTPTSWSNNIDTVSSSLGHSLHINTFGSGTAAAQEIGLCTPPERILFGGPFRETLNVNFHGEEDLRFIMSYKDYVFPLLHPFYHPSFFEGGHNWLLVAALRNSESRQLIVSLVTCFFSVVPLLPGAGYTLCSAFTWDEVQSQSEKAFKGMQNRVKALSQRGVGENLWESTHLFGDIMLLLDFETMTQYYRAWRVHLDAAIILFDQILSSPPLREGVYWTAPDPATVSPEIVNRVLSAGGHAFSSSQASLRFFAAKVIIADIISSSALEQTPCLREYHAKLIGGEKNDNLSLKNVTGCENWVYLSIADIVELDVWKKQTKKSGTFSFMTLVQRAGKIVERLDLGLKSLSDDAGSGQDHSLPALFSDFTLQRNMRPSQSVYNKITRIWANATRLYLIVFLSGWHPESREVIDLVSANLALLGGLERPSWLMTLAWPFCVTGCLAPESQQTSVERIFNSAKPLSNVGCLAEAMKVVQEMWNRRGTVNQEDWDMAACFQCLDSVPLLV